jgi:hypothetical protein
LILGSADTARATQNQGFQSGCDTLTAIGRTANDALGLLENATRLVSCTVQVFELSVHEQCRWGKTYKQKSPTIWGFFEKLLGRRSDKTNDDLPSKISIGLSS